MLPYLLSLRIPEISTTVTLVDGLFSILSMLNISIFGCFLREFTKRVKDEIACTLAVIFMVPLFKDKLLIFIPCGVKPSMSFKVLARSMLRDEELETS